ncbi:MAG: protein kinase [Acidobacteriota bacterium]|nr:protein kinase [Acidobacteriota bacterium]
MALAEGTRLGPYEIHSAIGAGGMGEVYKATDTRLQRTVAVKVLPKHWADHADMKQRFEREAQALASLSHPHICVLHDIGRESPATGEAAIDFLVMEYLEGETLAARLERGAIGLDEALKLGIQIADALDKAHRRGVVHRDLKPANVMLTPGGTKLLDFGLAKTGAGSAGGVSALSGVTVLPARTDLTTPGAMIGTLQYMAPEQLEGSEADARTDIFAFGVLLHEMVSGKRTFVGKTQVLLISAIATSTPEPLSKVEPATPPALDHVLATCLAKDPADRWQTARDLLAELEWIAEGGASTQAAAPVRVVARSRAWLYRGLIAAVVLPAAAMVAPALLYLRGPDAQQELRFRVPIQLTAEARAAGGTGGAGRGSNTGAAGTSGPGVFDPANFAVSPDGRAIAFVARQTIATEDSWILYVRPIGAVTPQRLPGTEGAAQPFWSADSRWIGFIAGTKLKRVEASGGPPQEIADASGFSGGTWNREGVILFGSAQGLFRVPAEGGKPEAVTTLDGSENGHFWPHFLPDGRHYLYTAWSGQAASRAIVAGTLDSKDKTRILSAGSNAGYSNPGYVIFHRDSAVYAQTFDAATLAVSGEPVRIADEVTFDSANGRGDFRVSQNGVLAYFYLAGGTAGAGPAGPASDLGEWQLAWIDRAGQVVQHVGPPGAYRGVEVSPDAKRIAVHRHDANGGDIYVIEPRGSQLRLTRDASRHSSMPLWSPDGSRIVYASLRSGKWGLYQTLSSGSGAEEPLHESDLPKAPMSWSPDGKRIVFWVQDPKTGSDLWVLTVEDKKAAPIVAEPFNETHGQISRDGKWLAYTSNSKDNRNEIYVKPFPTGAGGWQVSFTGGDWPRWRGDSKEIFYHSPVGATGGTPYAFGGPMYSVQVNAKGDVFEPDTPREVVVFPALNVPHSGGDYHPYAVAPDGQRFLVLQFVAPTTAATGQIGPDTYSGLTVAMNWAPKK